MSAHAYHEGLPGYVADAVLHTGCEECEHRARDLASALDAFDVERVERLWRRAASAYDTGYRLPDEGGPTGAVLLDPLEVPLLHAVQAIQRVLQRAGREGTSYDPRSSGGLGELFAVLPLWVAQTRPPRT